MEPVIVLFRTVAIVLFASLIGGALLKFALKAIFSKPKEIRDYNQPQEIKKLKPLEKAKPKPGPYEKFESRGTLLTPTESKFFNVLSTVISDEKLISCKVRLEDIVSVKRGLDKNEEYGLRGRVKSRHIDFVVTEKKTSKIELLIELDDPSHYSKEAIKADTFKNELTKSVGVPLLRIPVARQYRVPDLIKKIENCVPGKN
ncbi:DUF2726 domain-containing protein [Puniceicoccaceae bacterium K14]|nr:DUF2726 domain-containing protein [Puniceicoccaceae bacterium K14]